MTPLARRWILIASIVGALSVVLGAFGAHGVPSYFANQGFADIEQRMANFETAARYQTYGALFLFLLALALDRQNLASWQWACRLMLSGVIVFAGVLYAVALVPETYQGTFGRFAPVGGSLMIAAWMAAGWGAWRGTATE